MVLLGFQLDLIPLEYLPQYVLNEFLSGRHKRLLEPYHKLLVFAHLTQQLLVLQEVHDGRNVPLVVEGLAQLGLEDVAGVVRGLVLKELLGEVAAAVEVGLTLEVPGETL